MNRQGFRNRRRSKRYFSDREYAARPQDNKFSKEEALTKNRKLSVRIGPRNMALVVKKRKFDTRYRAKVKYFEKLGSPQSS
jgi:hypothetical protein